jgi:dipeptidyl aminopeptidase/acylaminoacyl peptidase
MRVHAGTDILRVQGFKMLLAYHRPAGSFQQRFPTVLFLHGFPGSEKNVDIQRALMKRGIASVAPSFLGAWGSGGRYRFTTLVSQSQAVLRAMKKYTFVDPKRCAVFGFSMGGWVALNLAARETSLKTVVAVAPCGGPEMITASTKSYLARLSRPLLTPPQNVLAKDFKMALSRFDPAQAILQMTQPVLLIPGDQDETIPAEISRRLSQRRPTHARLIIEKGADHGFLDRRERLVRRVVGWFEPRL